MKQSHRAILFATVLLSSTAGAADATDGKDAVPPTDARRDNGASTTSMGAAGLTGTGAVEDGARTGDGKAQTGGANAPAAPAAGTTR